MLAMSPQRFWTPLVRSYVILRRMGVRVLLMRTRSLSVGYPAMGRKADVAVVRDKARAVGVMVAGWEGSGALLVVEWEILVDIGDNCSKRM